MTGERSDLVAGEVPGTIRLSPHAMGSGSRRLSLCTVCIRDDDAKTFEFRTTGDSTEVLSRVTAAIAKGRKVRFSVTGFDPSAREQEERYLKARGYTRGGVEV